MSGRDKRLRDRVAAGIGRLEAEGNIAPPMRLAVTVPVLLDGKDSGIAVYVAVGAFAPQIRRDADVSNSDIMYDVAARIREALS